MKLPFQNKFRLDRGPLRGWLIIVGVLTISIDPTRYAIGAILILLGTALHFVSKGCLRQNRQLTLSGPYRFTRNPFYLANLIVESGLLVMIGNPWVAAVYLAAWFYIYGRTIREEEAHLSSQFGEAFADYCRSVPRLFPLPGKYLKPERVTGPKFSLANRNIAEGHEIERALRLISYPLLLLAAAAVHMEGIRTRDAWDADLLTGLIGFTLLNCLGYMISVILARRAAAHANQIAA